MAAASFSADSDFPPNIRAISSRRAYPWRRLVKDGGGRGHVLFCRGRRHQRHVVERRQQDAAIERVQMDQAVELGIARRRGLAPASRALAAEEVLHAAAQPRYVP